MVVVIINTLGNQVLLREALQLVVKSVSLLPDALVDYEEENLQATKKMNEQRKCIFYVHYAKKFYYSLSSLKLCLVYHMIK